jgi:hypothetical protein
LENYFKTSFKAELEAKTKDESLKETFMNEQHFIEAFSKTVLIPATSQLVKLQVSKHLSGLISESISVATSRIDFFFV